MINITTFTLSSCFLFGDFTTHPDMVEYTENEILEVAKDKYGVTEWIFTGYNLQKAEDGNIPSRLYLL